MNSPSQAMKHLEDTLRARLQARFPFKESLAEDEFGFDPDEAITGLVIPDADILAAFVPSYRFYRTRLQTCFSEYPEVEIVAAIGCEEPLKVHVLVSPTFDPKSTSFEHIFVNIKVEPGSARNRLAQAIAEMYVALIYRGTLAAEEMPESAEAVVFNLYRDGVSQNLIEIRFDGDARLSSICLLPGRGRDSVPPSSR